MVLYYIEVYYNARYRIARRTGLWWWADFLHSDIERRGREGTFAVLVVILWHSWSVILRPEIFPLDKSMFTGKIELERLHEEHALEYERIFGTQPQAEESAGDEGGQSHVT